MSFFSSRGYASAKGDTDAWCAGAVEEVIAFLNSYKRWYAWFVVWPFGVLLVFGFNVPAALSLLGYKEIWSNRILLVSWMLVICLLAVMFFARDRLLPSYVLVISNEEGFLRRNAAQLGLLIALASAILTVIGWFVGK